MMARSLITFCLVWFSHFPCENYAFTTATKAQTTSIAQPLSSSMLFSATEQQQQGETSSFPPKEEEQQPQLTNDVILYDGVCNFCNTWVDLLLRIDLQQKFKFAPLQSKVGRQLLVSIGKEADDISSVILVKAGGKESYDKSRCVLKVVEELGPLAKVASKTALNIVPTELRDSIYDTVAENRYNFLGKRDECRCSDPNFADRFLLD